MRRDQDTVSASATVEGVKDVLVVTLGIEDRAGSLDASTRLFGSLPELDSLAVVELAAGLERRFGITIDGEDVTGEVFETIGSLSALVDAKLGSQG